MIHILTAMEKEAEALGIPCETIGIGATDLPEIKPGDVIVNVGYCGGYRIPVGTVVEPDVSVCVADGSVRHLERHFAGKVQGIDCYTDESFVTEPMQEAPAVYDMELSKLLQIPCKDIYCLKIVSDNLSEPDCEAFHDETAWNRIRELLREQGLI